MERNQSDIDPKRPPEGASPEYVAPRLIRYGDLAEFTRSNTGFGGDGGEPGSTAS